MSKNIILLVGKSASGKTTITNSLEKNFGFKSLQSYTTRPKRTTNETGHTFVTNEEFNNLKDICAYGEFGGYKYCATKEQVDNSDIYVIDAQGVEYFKKYYHGKRKPRVVYISISPIKRFIRLVKRDGFKNGLTRWLQDISHFKGVKKVIDCEIKIKKDNNCPAISEIVHIWERGNNEIR